MTSENKPTAPLPDALPVTIASQYVKDFSFENPNAPAIYSATASAPDIAMVVNIQTHGIDAHNFEVLLTVKIEAKLQGKIAFVAELVYGGAFVLPSMAEEQRRMFLLIEAPRLLFPFARNILMTAVRDGGFPNVMINPVDFYALYLANKDKVGAMATSGAA